MNIKTVAIAFCAVFAISLGMVALLTFLWNLIQYGERTVNWEVSISFALLIGCLVARKKIREIKGKSFI
jgi:hypothetical protein